ncbi:DNA repair protein RecO [Xanthomonas axonopodis pv. vasculorum]|uniref:DNA repair protein RecO n=1 Tax=Xanthomonas axonopodis pv. vasculorum TaxID=325777 RepID=A0A098Q0E6_9XANT|nr:DNA repair protein RecO [Xanthomonas axonopodis]KGE52839.1 DNA recombination protein RecO [Xanthomonas axonopodis pv. vasculorum]PPV11157.1 DNA repair protein RecO [Xanthomonas axonopodis pv. vasculorum]QKD88472.1 DNA repair protein RecO [Xanthomonas axonopodis pv. vasculorum]
MLIEHARGFVLHVRAWRETSLLVEVLTEQHGRVGLLARGVQGPRKQALRAALQPLQLIQFSAVQRGELAQLRQAEALDTAPRLVGDAMLAGFYISELLLRLAPRNDPVPELYACYAQARAYLASDLPLAWGLRRFERDVLDGLGFAFDLQHDSDGQPIDPAARYRLDPQEGALRVFSERLVQDRRETVTGAALLALCEDVMPDVDDMPGLRRSMRSVLLHHLGGRGLKSWEMLEDLVRRR